MNKLQIDWTELESIKQATISICCFLIIGVGFFIFLFEPNFIDQFVGIINIVIGSVASFFCTKDWIIPMIREVNIKLSPFSFPPYFIKIFFIFIFFSFISFPFRFSWFTPYSNLIQQGG